MQLEGAVCVITGASGGIGQALAAELANHGARLILAGRRDAALRSLAGGLPEGSVITVCPGDLTNTSDREALARLAEQHGVSALINASGVNCFGLLECQRDEDVEAMMAANLTAPIALTRRLLPHLQSRDEALVVNVGSAFDSIGFPGYVLYSASKFGLRGFSEALARELADGPVRVVHVAPRATATAMNPPEVTEMNRTLGNSEDPPAKVAARIVTAMRKDRRRSAIGLPERFFARINQTLPGLVDRALGRRLSVIKQFASPENRKEATS